MECGGDPARFWKLTPREIAREMTAMKRRAIRSRNENMMLAWHTAFLHRVDIEKFPKLETLLIDPDRKPGRRMSQDEILANLKLAFGYPGEAPKP